MNFSAPKTSPYHLFFVASLLTVSAMQLCAANPEGAGPEAAAKSIKELKAADSLTVSLFASEPMVRNPTDMDIDERGRVWITEGVNYRSSFKPWGILQPDGDRIVILADTNSDGLADQQTVFYQDPSINAAIGICVLGNKVIVSDSPNVFLLTDTDGDGHADRRELLFTGISGFDHDHGVHAFTFGPDGKLYFNMGNESKQLRYPLTRDVPLHGPIDKVPSRPVVDLDGNEVNNLGHPYRMGMVFRCNLDGTDVETLAWNFRNNYEVAVDSFGTLWQSDNDDDGNKGVRINYVMEYGNYGYSDEMTGAGWRVAWDQARAKGAPENEKVFYEWHQYDPGTVPNLLHTGAGSPTGILLYEGKLLPEIFRNQVLHCDAGPRVVRAYPVQPAGAGYHAETQNILTSSNTWFRPSDLCVAPDGSVYVADWNDANVGGHNMADQKLETMTGRIYRVAPEGSRPFVTPLNLKTASGCVAALQSPNLSTRYLAWSGLHEMQGKAASELLKLWKGNDPRIRARALQLLARIKGSENKYVNEAIKDSNADIRITGLRIARALKLDLIPLIRILASDASPQVRRECAIALRHHTSPDAPGLWAKLAIQHDGQDRWYLEALGIGADRQWDPFLREWLAEAGPRWNTAPGRDIVWRSRANETPNLLVKLLSDDHLTVKERERYFRSLDFVTGPQQEAALVQLVEHRDGDIALAALSRLKNVNLEASPAIKTAVLKALDRTQGTPRFVEMVREFKIQDRDPVLLAIAAKEPSSSTSADAMRLVLSRPNSALLKGALAGSNAVGVAEALGNSGSKETVPLLEPVVTDLSRDLVLRKQAVRSLAQIQDGARALLKLAEDQKLPSDLHLVASSELNRVHWEDIKSQAAHLLPLPQTQNAQPLPPISELLRSKGDSAKGAGVFRRDSVACIKCHQVNGEGVDVGPNLSEIGTKLGKDALYESILEPSAGISFGYETWQLALKNGDEPFGLIVSETTDEVVIKNSTGLVSRFKKSEITQRKQQKLSLMPAGLQQTMSTQELIDLVEYLSSLKK